VRFTGQEEYGLRCILQVARHRTDEPLTISEIARKEGLSVPYVAKLMSLVRKAGLVDGVRGRKGGYVLARPAGEISVADVLSVLGQQLYAEEFCDRWTGELGACAHKTDCAVRSLWKGLERLIVTATTRVTLADLVCGEEEAAGTMESQWYGSALPEANRG